MRTNYSRSRGRSTCIPSNGDVLEPNLLFSIQRFLPIYLLQDESRTGQCWMHVSASRRESHTGEEHMAGPDLDQ